MAQIPTYQTRVGSIDVGNGVNLPEFDQTLSRSIQAFGVSLKDVGDRLQARQQQQSTFSAEQGFLQFQNQIKENYVRSQATDMSANGVGWHDAWTPNAQGTSGAFDKAANDFLASVPPDLRPQYQQKINTFRSGLSVTAAGDEIAAGQAWFKAGIAEQTKALETEIRRGGAVNFDEYRQAGDDLISKSGLAPATKEKLTQDWHATAAKARSLGIAANDPQAALDEIHSWLNQQPTTTGSGGGGATGHALSVDTSAAIDKAADAAGIPRNLMRAYALIESGGNPGASLSGPYKGLFQLSEAEFASGGGGNIGNAADNARAAAVVLKGKIEEFHKKFGRNPAPVELYLMHQQGTAGAFAHLSNPGAPAWQNMLSTGEGQAKGEGWAKKAVWGNIPDDVKKQFPGGVETVSSADFIRIWARKVDRFGGGTSPLNDLSPDELDKLAGGIQGIVTQQRVEDNRVAAEGREQIVKFGEDLIHNAGDPTKPQLTDNWVQANRDNLTPSDYKYFKSALDKDEGAIHTPPQELLRLDDLVQSDPKKALTELRDQFASRGITRGTYDQLTTRAQGIINGEEKRPFIGQIRDYLKQQIAPGSDASSAEYQTALTQLFAFDNWATQHKDATSQDAQREVTTIIGQRQAYRTEALRQTLPIPRFMDAPNRFVIGPDQVAEAKQRTAKAVADKIIGEAEAVDEANKIKAWEAVVNARNQLPAR